MTSEEIKEKQENQNAGHITSFIVHKITELETMRIKKEIKIELLKAIIQVTKNIIKEIGENYEY